MVTSLRNIWSPERYHGTNKKGPFFEGWYYKLVCPQKNHVVAIIPGIFLDKNQFQSHAFIQFLDSEIHETLYHQFDVNQFHADSDTFDIKIGKNRFNKNSVSIDIDSDGRKIAGVLNFQEHYPWPVSLFSPGVMGWYSFVPFMQCYHGTLSLDHRISGKLNIDGRVTDFTGGRGYMEKDWGVSFPRAYVWMQSNHFDDNGTSLFVSVALIPWFSGAFRGFLAGFLFRGQLYRLTTYTGARIKELVIGENSVQLVISDGRYTLEINASRTDGGVLFGPDGHNFFQHISETLKSQIAMRFSGGGQIIYEGNGFPAGLEINGRTELIL